MRAVWLSPLVLLVTLAVCGEEVKNEIPADLLAIFEKAESITLFAVATEYVDEGKEGALFHHYKILGKVDVTKADERKKLLDAVKGTLQKGPEFMAAKCFEPRHALRATVKDKTADILICFECSQGYAYDGAGKDAKSTFLYFNANAREFLNKTLKDGNVAPAPKSKE